MPYNELARQQYQKGFGSNLFNPVDPRSERVWPDGKRRDMTADELFGGNDDPQNFKRAELPPFCPKDDPRRATERKLTALDSNVIPRGERTDPAELVSQREPRKFEKFPSTRAGDLSFEYTFQEGNYSTPIDRDADAWRIRQQNLQSNVFGHRSIETDEQNCKNRKGLIPSNYSWSTPCQTPQDPNIDYTVSDSSYAEKSSNVFEYESAPRPNVAELKQLRADEQRCIEGEEKNRTAKNQQYSDLFGRPSPRMDENQTPKRWDMSFLDEPQGPAAHELAPRERRFRDTAMTREPCAAAPLTTNNSSKVSRNSEQTLKEVHQLHMRSSMVGDEFYREASTAKAWKVAEINLRDLPPSTDELTLKKHYQRNGSQVVRIMCEMDPVTHACIGRAQIILRYNPEKYDLENMPFATQEVTPLLGA